ncbi:hypothetical protein GOV10_02005 [Candidatus Woesearchaeota archaeon]|nr:hypothetical protein [Candidatus Woesearchaeota archaeon]
MKKLLFIMLIATLFLVGCVQTSKVVCNSPYIMVGDSCCLDKDDNAICDRDEREDVECEEIALDCSECPPKIITETETIEIMNYVCSDGISVVDDLDDCDDKMSELEPEYTPVMTNEDDQIIIEEVSVRPACRGGFNAIEIHLKVGSAFDTLDLQFKNDIDVSYASEYSYDSPTFEKYIYGVFCDNACTGNADFFISPGEKYLFRTKFDYRSTSWDKIFYSNEHVIDATADGEYTTKLC